MKKPLDMTKGPLLPAIIRYTIPVILTSILQLLFNAADLVIVGRYCGSISVAAVGATGAVTALMVNPFIGLSIGVGVTVAQGLGAEDYQEVHRTVHTAIPAAFYCGLFLTLLGLVLTDPLLRMMGTPETVLPLSSTYMKLYFCGMAFSMVYNFAASILRAAGDTRSPLVFLTIAGIVNVGLNVIFVTVFDLNVAGVALATAISQGVSAVLVVIVLRQRTDACYLNLKELHIYKPQLIKIIRIGLPAGIQSSLFSISNVIIQSSVNSFGDIFMSGHAAAGNIEGFVYVALNAFQQAAVNFIGQNIGAQNLKRVRQTFWTCLISVTVVGLTLGPLVYAFGPQLLSIYITDSTEAIGYGMVRMSYILLPYFLCGLMDVATGSLRGMGSSVQPMIISILGICGLRLLWIFTIFQIPQFHTPQCLYFSYTISWSTTFLIEFVAFLVLLRKKARLMPSK